MDVKLKTSSLNNNIETSVFNSILDPLTNKRIRTKIPKAVCD